MKTTSNLEKKIAAKRAPAKRLGVKVIPVTGKAQDRATARGLNEILDRVENREDLGFVVGIQELPEPQAVVESDEVQVMVDPNGVLYPNDLKDLGLKASTEEDTVVLENQLQECDIFTDEEVEELSDRRTRLPDGVKVVPVKEDKASVSVKDRASVLEALTEGGVGKAWKTEPLEIPRHVPKPFDGVYPPPTLITKKIVDAPHEESEADDACETSVYAELDSLASEVLEEFGVIGTISPGEEGILYLIRKINTERLVLRDLEAALRAATEIFIKEGK